METQDAKPVGSRVFVSPRARKLADEYQVDLMVSPSGLQYQKFVFKDDCLLGVSAINADLDPGVLSEMIFGRISLDAAKARLAREPRDTGRLIMSGMWR